MQGADLVKNFALQLLAAVLQQRTVNVAADHFDGHSTTPFISRFYCTTGGGDFSISISFCIIDIGGGVPDAP